MNTAASHKPSHMASARTYSLVDGLRRLFAHVSRRRRIQCVLLFGLLLVGALAELMTIGAVLPFLALMVEPGRAVDMPFISAFFGGLGWKSQDLMIPVTLLFVAMAMTASAVRMLLAWASQKYVYRLGHDISIEVYSRALYQPYSYHIAHNSSELISQTNKVHTIISSMLIPLMQLVTSVVIATFIFAALLIVNALVALVVMGGFGMLYVAISLVTGKALRSNSQILSVTQTQRIKIIQEGIGGIRDVLINRTQNVYIDAYIHVDLLDRDAVALNSFIGTAPRIIIEGVGMVLIAVVALFLSRGEGGLGTALPVLGALALGAARLLPLLQLIYYGWSQVIGHRSALFDVLEVLNLPVPVQTQQLRDAGPPLPFSAAITFKAVSFQYQPGRPAVLKDIDLTIPKSTRVGITGKTGSGKSTFVDLIMGLLMPTSGSISIDGQSLTASNMAQWQQRIAHVPQAIYLTDASIAENIAFGVPRAQIDRDRLIRATRQAAISDFIEGLPEGYDTLVGERGARLSGGQRQRIGIARALYRDADVLVFDEATSALDMETEIAVMDAVTLLGRDLTILIIAHRLSTLKGCDMLIQLDHGRINVTTPHDLPGMVAPSTEPTSP